MKSHITAATLMLAAAFVGTSARASFVGNYGSPAGLAGGAGQTDGLAPLVILGEYDPSGPSGSSAVTLPAGTVNDVDFYGGNYNFTLYALSPADAGPNAKEQTFTVVNSESFSGSVAEGVNTLAVSPGFTVAAGDLLAFAGVGPEYLGADVPGSDATYDDANPSGTFVATPPGGSGSQFIVGLNGDASANYEYIPDTFVNQGRTYAFGVDVTPVPEPATMIMGALLLLPFGARALRAWRKNRAA